ncbi:MAG: exopolyphosphatase, partial [Planctomycetota bacterium]
VAVLRDYRRTLEQYGLSPGGRGLSGRRGPAGGGPAGDGRLRVVATSAVREASNRLTFLDRIFAATGIEIEPIDEAETTRVTYLGVLPHLLTEPRFHQATVAVAEVGGGTTDLLAIQNGDVRFSHSYRVGALRMREAVRAAGGATPRQLWERQADRAARRMASDLPEDAAALMALGADVRFAANHLLSSAPGAGEEPDAGPEAPAQRLPLPLLRTFLDDAFARSEDELVRRYHLPFEQAETLRPALLVTLRLAEALGLDEVTVAEVHLRDGLIRDTAGRGDWTDRAAAQAIQSAIALGKRYRVDGDHARHVAELAGRLFEQLADRHRLEGLHGRLLTLAALLHEVGLFVGTTGYHKHSMYLIANSDLFGVSRRDLHLIGLVARYHRRASPKATHTPFTQMDRPERVAVAKLAAILRLAKALDESRSGRVKDVTARIDGDRLVLTAKGVDDLSLERLAVKQSGPLFREIYGLRVLLRVG